MRGGVHTRRAVRGWGVNISEDARHWIGLLQYNPSTVFNIPGVSEALESTGLVTWPMKRGSLLSVDMIRRMNGLNKI
jgi:hypothetical protein